MYRLLNCQTNASEPDSRPYHRFFAPLPDGDNKKYYTANDMDDTVTIILSEVERLLQEVLTLAPRLRPEERPEYLASIQKQITDHLHRLEDSEHSEPGLVASRLDEILSHFYQETIRLDIIWLLSPLYPFGFYPLLRQERDQLIFKLASRTQQEPCNCRLLQAYALPLAPGSSRLTKIGEYRDAYDEYESYRCDWCGTIWRHEDVSTEQYSLWRWRPEKGDG